MHGLKGQSHSLHVLKATMQGHIASYSYNPILASLVVFEVQ